MVCRYAHGRLLVPLWIRWCKFANSAFTFPNNCTVDRYSLPVVVQWLLVVHWMGDGEVVTAR